MSGIYCPCCERDDLTTVDFYAVKSRKSGRSAYCKECCKAKRREQAKSAKGKAQKKKHDAKYYQSHKSELNAKKAQYFRDNREQWNRYQNERNKRSKSDVVESCKL